MAARGGPVAARHRTTCETEQRIGLVGDFAQHGLIGSLGVGQQVGLEQHITFAQQRGQIVRRQFNGATAQRQRLVSASEIGEDGRLQVRPAGFARLDRAQAIVTEQRFRIKTVGVIQGRQIGQPFSRVQPAPGCCLRGGETSAELLGPALERGSGGQVLRDEALVLRGAHRPPDAGADERGSEQDEQETGAGHGRRSVCTLRSSLTHPALAGTPLDRGDSKPRSERSPLSRGVARSAGVCGSDMRERQSFAGRQRVMRSMRSKGG
jgi:hypothetical protein